MDVVAIAKELGEAIAVSKEMKDLKRWEAEVEKSHQAKALLNDLKLLQIELAKAQKEGRDMDILDGIRQRLASKQQEVNNLDITRNFMEAREGFDRLMRTINRVIIFGITGEEQCSGGNCGTCSGCQ